MTTIMNCFRIYSNTGTQKCLKMLSAVGTSQYHLHNFSGIISRKSQFTRAEIKMRSMYTISMLLSPRRKFDVDKAHVNISEDMQLVEPVESQSTLKVAVIGVPNSGKSTLINQIMSRRICSTSSKVHTTRKKTKAILTSGDIQLIFLDTPGLVTPVETKRHGLESSFLADGEASIKEADLIAIIHDVSNSWTRDFLDRKVLRLLHKFPDKHSILILNKVDNLKSKRILLDLSDRLSNKSMNSPQQDSSTNQEVDIRSMQFGKDEVGWSKFDEIFMISALNGSGVGDIKEYMFRNAKQGAWSYPTDTVTDQKPKNIVEEAVREKLMDHLPKEVPYKINTRLEFWEKNTAGLSCIVVLVDCPSQRYRKMLLGNQGSRIKRIALEAEQALSNSFRCGVKLKIVVTDKDTK